MNTQQTQTDSIRVERLAHLCKLWGVVKFFHPYLASRDIDWDAALVAAIPMVNAAATSEEYAAAVQSMLEPLDDPATRIIPNSTGSSTKDLKPLACEFTEDGVLVVTVGHGPPADYFDAAQEKLRAISDQIPKACGVLFDLRAIGPLPPNAPGLLAYLCTASDLNSKLSTDPLYSPGQRTRMHVGFAPHKGFTSGGYYSAFQISDGERFSPSSEAQDKPVVFLVNEQSALPSVALALQSAGKAAIVVEGRGSDASLIKIHTVSLGEELEAEVRLSELVYQDGPGGLHPDMVLSISPHNQEDQALQAALALVRDFDFKGASRSRTPLVARGVPQSDKIYSEMTYPALEYRLLAAFRIWNIVNYFFPYKELMEEEWDGLLNRFIVKMEAASDALEYTLSVAEMVKHLHDSHAFISSAVLRDYFGAAPPAVRARMIEGVPVITRFLDDSAAREAGIEIGDVVLKIDGEEASRRIERYAKYIAASTPQALMLSATSRFMNGPDNSVATLTVRDRMDQIKEINLPRSEGYRQNWNEWRSGDIFNILPGNIGYADLDRLTDEMVDQMFEMFKETKAIIFDMRGYPNGTAWAIAPRLTSKNGVVGAMFQCPLVLRPKGWSNHIMSQPTTDTFLQPIPRTDKWRYQGQTVMLIDERTISQAEHTGLFFEAANGTKFIGSHTTGANGDVTNFYLPGDILIHFTGQAVKHADGRPLQRIGLVPDIEVKPTISGIQAGKDEVLEKALEFLRNGD